MFAVRSGLKIVSKPAVARVMSSNAVQAQLADSENVDLTEKKIVQAYGEITPEMAFQLIPTPWDYMFHAKRPEGLTVFNDRRFVPSSVNLEDKHYNPERFIPETRNPLPRSQDNLLSRTHPDGNWNVRNIFGYPINGDRSEKHKMAKILDAKKHH